MLRFRLIGVSLLASAAIVALPIVLAQAADDTFMTMAKEYVAQAAAPVTTWTGPTTGPKAQTGKLVIYVSADQKNGGAQGVGDGAQEAAKAMGWDFRILDGQGSVPARSSALTQAIALKPAGIILGTIDAAVPAVVHVPVIRHDDHGVLGEIEGFFKDRDVLIVDRFEPAVTDVDRDGHFRFLRLLLVADGGDRSRDDLRLPVPAEPPACR